MIRIYGSGGARSRRALWTCEEAGAPYEFVALKMPVREHHPDFLQVSPAGALPAMEHGGIRMVESLAISEYIARLQNSDLVVGPQEAGFPDYLQYLWFGESTLAPPLTWARRFAEHSEAVADMGRTAFVQRQAVLQRALEDGRAYLAAGRFTLADISVGYTLGLARLFGLGDRIAPSVAAYEDRLKARPAYQRAYAV
jgi:glutathione S-transferase